MFGKKENVQNPNDTHSPSSSNLINSLVAGTNIEGTVFASSDIRIDGTITGSLHCSGKVIIGQDGKVIGDIQCENAVIEGSFDGTLNVSSTLNVKETASIKGDINTNKLLVQNGAVFNVSCNMGGSKIKNINDLSSADVEVEVELAGIN